MTLDDITVAIEASTLTVQRSPPKSSPPQPPPPPPPPPPPVLTTITVPISVPDSQRPLKNLQWTKITQSQSKGKVNYVYTEP